MIGLITTLYSVLGFLTKQNSCFRLHISHSSPLILFQAGPGGYQAQGNFRGQPQPQPPMDPAGYAAYQQQYFGWLQHQAQMGNPQVYMEELISNQGSHHKKSD